MERLSSVPYLITLPKTGLRIIPPPETQRNVQEVKTNRTPVIWSEEEKARIRLLISNPIYRKRYPDKSVGKEFMNTVDYQRRERLLSYANEMTDHIVTSWQHIGNENAIAVVLFGSVATGLVKHPMHPSPSNIDMAVIGDITLWERELLFDEIRSKRQEIQKRILEDCFSVEENEYNPGNVGVSVQHTSKVTNGNYQCALEYIAANATPLYDPSSVWGRIEQEALNYYIERERTKRREITVFSSRQHSASNEAQKKI